VVEKKKEIVVSPYETYVVVLVPKPNSAASAWIDARAGIVACQWTNDRIEVYFEGNSFGDETLRSFEERVKCAAGRLQHRYPTIARGWFASTDFEEVGKYIFASDWRMDRLTITNQGALARWLQGHENPVQV
jgi:hypothetical protein